MQAAEGVYGARFSGAGTRGACVALVRAVAVEDVARQVTAFYYRNARKCLSDKKFHFATIGMCTPLPA